MAKIKWTRPENDSEFTQSSSEKDMMAYYVLFETSKMAAWARFHPEHTDVYTGKLISEGILAYKSFFDKQQNKDFIKACRATLTKRSLGQEIKSEQEDNPAARISDERKDDALMLLLDQALRIVEKGETLDPDTLKVVTELFKKLNIIKEKDKVRIEPLRFLPTLCRECRYKIFMESLVANGEAIDCCEYCKCRKITTEQGYIFNDKDLLDVPREVIEQFEKKNKVRIEDVISGKVEN